MNTHLLIPLVFEAMGLYLLVKGLRLQRGHEKWRYFSPWARTGGAAWMSIPGGIVLILWGLAFVPGLLFGISTTTAIVGLLVLISSFIIFFFGVLLIFVQPKLLKPDWLKWLESEHKEMMPLLRREAREMGLDVWQRRVDTQEGLEEWVAEVRRKHGLGNH